MSQLDREGYCTVNQYKEAHEARLQVAELTADTTAIMALFMRIKGNPDRAFMSPITIEEITHRPGYGSAGVKLSFLDPDMQEKFKAAGSMVDGLWNPNPSQRIGVDVSNDVLVDGVVGPYDDGLGADDLLRELVSVGVSSHVNLDSFRL